MVYLNLLCFSMSSSSEVDTAIKLCECVSEWQLENVGLDHIRTFDWNRISKLLESKGHKMSMSSCCRMWKFIAYGKRMKEEDCLDAISDDDEAYYQPLSALKRFKNNETVQSGMSAGDDGEDALTAPVQIKKTQVYIIFSVVIYLCHHFLFTIQLLLPNQLNEGTSRLAPLAFNDSMNCFNFCQ